MNEAELSQGRYEAPPPPDALLTNGWEPIPVEGKRPVADGWGVRDPAGQWQEHTLARNVGIRCGRPVVGADIDILDVNLAAAARTVVMDQLGVTLLERVGRKGMLLVYRARTPRGKIKVEAQPRVKDAPAFEILALGQQFVAYGLHPDTGRPYEWVNECFGAEPLHTAVADLPEVTPEQLLACAQAIVELFREHGYQDARITQGAVERKRADDAGKLAEGVEFNKPHAIDALTAWLKRAEPAVEGAAGDPHTIEVLNHALDQPVTPDELFPLVLEHWNPRCSPPWETDDLLSKLRSAVNTRQNAIGCKAVIPPEMKALAALPEQTKAAPRGDLQSHFARSKTTGRPLQNFENALLAAYHMSAKPRFNELAGRVEFDGELPWPICHGRVLDDNLSRIIREDFLVNAGLEVARNHVDEALLTVAAKNRFHPVRDRLTALAWDGVERIDRWLIDYAGAEDTPYVRAVGRKMLLGAVARVMNPGCKFDTMLVLESPQGWNKSKLCAALALESEWFTDGLPSELTNKDAVLNTLGKWIVEVSELDRVTTKRDAGDLKSYISRAVDRIRQPYDRHSQDFRRQFILIGTTNSESYLQDLTGDRRFWPVRVGRIGIEALIRDREQLWAEAVALWRKGEPLELPEDLWPAAAAEQEQRLAEDPWQAILSAWLDGHGEDHPAFGIAPKEPVDRVHSCTLLERVLGIGRARLAQNQSSRLKKIMTRLGWQYKPSLRIGPKVTPGYIRPGGDNLAFEGGDGA